MDIVKKCPSCGDDLSEDEFLVLEQGGLNRVVQGVCTECYKIINQLESQTLVIDEKQRISLYLTHRKGLKPQDIQNIVVHFHGFPGRPKKLFRQIQKHFSSKDFMIINFNYPGLWDTAGLFVPDEIIEYCLNILKFLFKHYQDKRLYVYAESFGAFTSLVTLCHLFKQNKTLKIDALAFRAPTSGINMKIFDGEKWAQMNLKEPLIHLSEENILRTDISKWDDITVQQFDIAFNLKELKRMGNEYGRILPKLVVVGKNDGLLSFEEILGTYTDHAQIELYDDLPHNYIQDKIFEEIIDQIVGFYLRTEGRDPPVKKSN